MGASDFSNLPHIGESVRRKEDYRFLTGAGQYTDDITMQAQSYAVFVRSPHAHAVIKSIDISAASAMPGVVSYPSSANFVLARLPDAGRAVEGLRRRNILVKKLHGQHPLLEQCVRFTVGTPPENDLLVAGLQGIFGKRADGTGMSDRVP